MFERHDFKFIWKKVQKEIKEGEVIRNWGKARGYTGNTFKIVSVTENLVVCKPIKAKNLQPVPKKDFQQVWELWKDYILGEVQRKFIRDEITRYSSYIISIYKYLDL